MERGGLTRRRGFLWLATVLSILVLIVLYIFRQPQPAPLPASAPQPQAAEPQTSSKTTSSFTQQPRQTRIVSAQQPLSNTPSSNHTTTYTPTPATKRHFTVALNSADSLDLVQLYNIGPAFARRIIKYRALLGGFVAKEQLMEVYGMDSARYHDIAPHITIDASNVTTLDVNTASIDQLKRHPYLDYYQAKAIVRHREQAGAYHNISDLQQVSLIDNQTYNKIAPYLSCSSQPNK